MKPASDIESARVALGKLGSERADNRTTWVQVGMALQSVSDELFDDWDRWSQQSGKYDARECKRQWKSFKRKSGGLNLGSLLHWAKEDSGSSKQRRKAEEDASRPQYESRRDSNRPAELVNGSQAQSPNSFPDPTAAARAAATHDGRTLTKVWIYDNPDGEVDFAVARLDPLPNAAAKGAKKTFRPFHRIGQEWQVGDPPGLLPLYRLKELIARSNEVVFVVEGEKCADEMHSYGFLATTSAHGASSSHKTDWSPLAGRDVIVIPDNDDPGRQYAAAVAAILTQLPKPAAVNRVDLVGLRKGGDIADLIESLRAEGLPIDAIQAEIQRRVEDHTAFGVKLIRASTVTTKAVGWLWQDRIPIGKLTLMTGDPDVGKTLVLIDVIARFTRGHAMPCCSVATTPPGSAVYVAAEDDLADTVVPRLTAAGADLTRVEFVDLCVHSQSDRGEPKTQFFTLEHIPSLELHLDRNPELRLIALDPITAFMGDTDTHRDADVRACLLKLSTLATRRRITIVAIQHLNKSAGSNAKHRVTGSLAFVAAARSVVVMGLHPEDSRKPNDLARRVLARTKANLAKSDDSIVYTLAAKPIEMSDGSTSDVPYVVWGDSTSVRASDLVQTPTPAHLGKVDRAREALEDALADGPIGTDQVDAIAATLGVSRRTMERASHDLGLSKAPTGFGDQWKWSIPSPAGEVANRAPTPAKLADSGPETAIAFVSTSPIASTYDQPPRVSQVVDDPLADSGPVAESEEASPHSPVEEPSPPTKEPRAQQSKRESSSSASPRDAKLRQRSIEELLDAVPLNVTAVAPESAKLVDAEPTPESKLADSGEEPRKPPPFGDSEGSRHPEIPSVCQIPVSQGLADSAEAAGDDAAPVNDAMSIAEDAL